MNSRLRDDREQFSHFSGKFRVVEHRVRAGFLWDHEYPERPIYNETVEVRVGDVDRDGRADVGYRWLSDGEAWNTVQPEAGGVFRFPLRAAGSLSGNVVIKAGPWPDPTVTME